MTPKHNSGGGWFEDRLGIGAIAVRLLSGTVERRWAWLRTTGMVCLVLFLVECVTGPVLGLYYTPSPASAYKEILSLEQNPIGRFLRGLHHWSSAALILLAIFTVARMFFGAEYKGRRDVVWIAALLFFQFVLLFQVTGHILPWDTNGVSTTSVEAGIAGNVWVVGPQIKRLILGGGTTGAVTLTRWYGLHALLLPLATILLCGTPLLLHRLKSGAVREAEAGASNDQPRPAHRTDPYYPHHMAREMLVALAVFGVVAVLALLGQAPLEKEATAANLSGYSAMSEWYVLPMHAATLIWPFNDVRFEPLVTMALPGLLFLVLLALPFIDRNPNRRPSRRRFAVACGALTVISIFGLYLFAFMKEKPMVEAQTLEVGAVGTRQIVVDTKLVEQGHAIYSKEGCSTCHAINRVGGKSAPDLARAGARHPDRDWQIEHLIKPDSMVPGSTMPAYGQMKKDDLSALAEYILSLR